MCADSRHVAVAGICLQLMAPSGYFDVRDLSHLTDCWIRVHVTKGDMIVIPAGIYHRVVLTDVGNNLAALRLFSSMMLLCQWACQWLPYPSRPQDDEHPIRAEYMANHATK